MITGIKLRHFKSHESTELDFTQGTNLIIGQMGSGKTSIVDGMCFALYGTFPSLKSRRVTIDDVVMARPTKYTDASVEVKFDANGSSYAVERSYRKGESQAYLRSGGQVIEAGPQRVTEAVSRLLSADYELFTRAVYSEQNRLDWFLSLGKGERKRYFDELLGISRFETARSTATTVGNRLKAAGSTLKAFLEGIGEDASAQEHSRLAAEVEGLGIAVQACTKSIEDTSARRDSLGKDIAALELKGKDHRARLQEASSAQAARAQLLSLIESSEKQGVPQLTEIQNKERRALAARTLDECRSVRQVHLLASSTLQKTGGELSSVQDGLARLKEVSDGDEGKIEAELAALQASHASTEEAIRTRLGELSRANEAQGSVNAWAKELAATESERATLQKTVKDCSDAALDVAAAQSAVASINSQVAESEATLRRSEQSMHLLEASSSHCPVCSSALAEGKAKDLHKQAQAQGARAKSSVEKEKAALGLAISDLQKAQEMQVKFANATDSLQRANDRGKKILAELDAARAKAAAGLEIEKKVSSLQASLATISRRRVQESQRLAGAKEYRRLKELSVELGAKQADALARERELSARVKPDEEARAAQEIALLDRAALAQEWRAKASALLKTAEDAQAAAKVIGFDEEALAKARIGLQEATAAHSSHLLQSQSLVSEMKGKEARLGEIGRKVKEAGHARARLNEILSVESGVLKLQSALEDTQGALRSELVSSLNDASGSLWKSIYPYGDYPSLRLVAAEDDYSLELQSLDGTWMAVEGASGGERVCAALCLRVALALVLSPKLSLIILDEPTHNMDSVAVEALSRALHDELPRFLNQAFLITHDSSLKEGASSQIYVVDRDKDAGDKSVVEQLSAQ